MDSWAKSCVKATMLSKRGAVATIHGQSHLLQLARHLVARCCFGNCYVHLYRLSKRWTISQDLISLNLTPVDLRGGSRRLEKKNPCGWPWPHLKHSQPQGETERLTSLICTERRRMDQPDMLSLWRCGGWKPVTECDGMGILYRRTNLLYRTKDSKHGYNLHAVAVWLS